MPFNASLLTVNPDIEVILLSRRDLAGMKHSFGPVLKTQEYIPIVIQFTAFDKSGKVCAKLRYFFTGHIFRKVESMRSNVAHTASLPGTGRIGSPGSLNVFPSFQRRAQPTLGILHDYFSYLSKQAVGNQFPRFLNHGICCICMGNRKDQPGLFDQFSKLFSFINIECQRLINNYMKPVLQCKPGRVKMHMIGCGNANKVHSLIRTECFFLFKHLCVG